MSNPSYLSTLCAGGYRSGLVICLALALLSTGLYWQVGTYDFIDFDDRLYVTENRMVQQGLTKNSIGWAFRLEEKENTYWQPLTWLSHMLDCELYGLSAGMHHRTNLLLHTLNAMLLFLVLDRMTRDRWKSAFVALLFAVHPVNVDSVAWIAERKNVLSTFLWMLAILAYVRYAEHPTPARYAATFMAFLMGLMAKPMLTTLPFVLLLLDVWPLGRFAGTNIRRPAVAIRPAGRLIVEKVPFLMLSLASLSLSIFSVKPAGPEAALNAVSMGLRIQNALVSYIGYIGKMIWPSRLSIFYPYPNAIPHWKSLGAGLGLLCLSVWVLRNAKTRPWLGVGWLWFLGTLMPVSGLVQTGLWPAAADRFAYLPFIGLFIMIAWGVPDLLNPWRHNTIGVATAAFLSVMLLCTITWRQIGYWENSFTLYEHALKVTENNYVIHYNYGAMWSNLGRTADAVQQYRRALKINPDFAEAHNNLGAELAKQGENELALTHYRQAVRLNPDFAAALCNIGNILKTTGRTSEAKAHYIRALAIDPMLADAHFNLGNLWFGEGNRREAVRAYRAALRIDPKFAVAYNNLGRIAAEQGDLPEAIHYFRTALQVDSTCAEARQNLSLALEIHGKAAR